MTPPGGDSGKRRPRPGAPDDPLRLLRKERESGLAAAEAEVLAVVIEAVDAQRERTLRKLLSVKARRGTRHWDYGNDFDPAREKKQIDPTRVFDVGREREVFEAQVGPQVLNVFESFGEGTAQSLGVSFNLHDPGVTEDLLQRSNRLKDTVDTTWQKVQEAIADGEREGETIDGIAKRIGKVFDQAGGYRARMIARTETVGAANAGSLAAAVQSNVVAKKVWLATTRRRPRSTHITADGQAVPVKGKFTVGAAKMDHPGDPAGGPSETINCRCTLLFQRVTPSQEPVLPESDVPVFKTNTEAVNWAKQQYPSADDLTAEQVAALQRYQSAGYQGINPLLRGSRLPAARAKDLRDEIARIDSALVPAPADLSVFRGVEIDAFGVNDVDALPTLVGKTFTDDGFMSTALGTSPPQAFKGKQVMMKVNVPKDTPSYFMPNVATDARMRAERELLLGHGRSFVVKSAKYNGRSGVWDLVVDVIE